MRQVLQRASSQSTAVSWLLLFDPALDEGDAGGVGHLHAERRHALEGVVRIHPRGDERGALQDAAARALEALGGARGLVRQREVEPRQRALVVAMAAVAMQVPGRGGKLRGKLHRAVSENRG